jgi:hypothetical protein
MNTVELLTRGVQIATAMKGAPENLTVSEI